MDYRIIATVYAIDFHYNAPPSKHQFSSLFLSNI